jgi:hypothetical protein
MSEGGEQEHQRAFGFLSLLLQTYVTLVYFVYPVYILWFTCSPPSDIGDLSRYCLSCLDPLVYLLSSLRHR